MEPNTELTRQVETVPARAQGLQIVDEASCVRGSELLLTIKGLRAKIEETFGPIVAKAHATWKEALAQRKKHDEPLDEAERTVKGQLAAYHDAQERIRRAEEQRLRDEAALQEAAEAEAAGETERAAEILETGPTVAVVVPSSTPQVAGISYREMWGAEVVDMKALCEHVVRTGQTNLVEPNMVALNGLARSLKDTMRIPGVRAVKQRSVAAGRR